jgi:hypothetical protein
LENEENVEGLGNMAELCKMSPRLAWPSLVRLSGLLDLLAPSFRENEGWDGDY